MGTRQVLAMLMVVGLLGVLVPAVARAEVKVRLNGQNMAFQVPPRTEEGRTLVPMRAIFEALGATITWNGDTQEIRATSPGGTEVYLKVGSKAALVNGQVRLLDVPPKIVEGRTLVPVRFVSESLGAKVDWEGATETVLIESGAGACNDGARVLDRCPGG
ncbi:MAG TPA: copper amine oxidase N-terminal domain-containing protein [Symbiobacteriaceae bacterium]|nr:copper amine oxidase N-terminal domain-containing protein [Symbiobacteriaceae bacterium]